MVDTLHRNLSSAPTSSKAERVTPSVVMPPSAAIPMPEPVTRRISLLIIDPTMPDRQRLSRALGWDDSDRLAAELISDLRDVSHGYVNYEIAERIVSDEFPIKADGFQYTAEDYLSRWRRRTSFHQPDAVDYQRIVEQFDYVNKIRAGIIDEVWTVCFPWGGFFESRMAGPGAFFCNAPPLAGAEHAARRFVIMCFNYERGVGEMLESYGHRAESILERVFADQPPQRSLWRRFTRYDAVAPDQAEVGNIHFAPNSTRDYEWGSSRLVPSRCRTWQRFPDLTGEPVMVDASEWGGGDIRAHHRWWFSLLPHTTGRSSGIANNWWQYIVDPNLV